MTAKVFLTSVVIMFCVSCGAQFSTSTVVVTPESILDVQMMKSQMGLVFVPAKASDIAKAKVSREEAIDKAQEAGAPVQEATTVFAELGYLSDPSLETAAANGQKVDPSLLDHPLVWIISCEGVDIPSSGPPESTHTLLLMNIMWSLMQSRVITSWVLSIGKLPWNFQ